MANGTSAIAGKALQTGAAAGGVTVGAGFSYKLLLKMNGPDLIARGDCLPASSGRQAEQPHE